VLREEEDERQGILNSVDKRFAVQRPGGTSRGTIQQAIPWASRKRHSVSAVALSNQK
jgi:hypothetical protein